jgi:uncharacterized protein
MKNVVIFGGSGFIGKQLVDRLKNNYKVIIISRYKKSTSELFDSSVKVERLQRRDITKIVEHIDGAKAIINLAGENVGKRWTKVRKQKITNSRLDIDSMIVRAVKTCNTKPEVLIQGSAIGFYGFSRINFDINENTSKGKRGFLTKLSISHEESVEQLESIIRVVYLRTGLVLGSDGGALPKMLKQYNLYVGGKFGNGKQWNSWIHIEDEIRAIIYLLENENCQGPYNLTAPNPVINQVFSSTLAKVLGKPNIFPTPAFALRLILGSMADELLLSGVKVIPERLLKDGFDFKFTNLTDALRDITKD